ncbi:MAG: hypothetical protein PVJ76_07800 [Gemmatimonadota bacterium]|jgi:hypothetical protein
MRKQYHLFPGPSGFLAWDVDRLVRLTKELEIQEVLLESIRELDDPFWLVDDPAPTLREVADHARLINETDLRHPIILGADGRVMDGRHRVAKAFIEGRHVIRAVRFLSDPEPDYVGVHPDDLPYDDEEV